MYHTKKIGVFISHIFGDYQKSVCQGIIDKAVALGYTVEIFSSMDGENLGAYGTGESGILHIPNYNDFDGVIFASETYLLAELRDEILTTLRCSCRCPVVEIAVYDYHFPVVSLENNQMFQVLTAHFITEHHCKHICYLGCASELFFSDGREHYYRKAMALHGLAIPEHGVYASSYEPDAVLDALHFFLQDGKPDAVVCYNDRMALLFIAAAAKAGFTVPCDIAVSGCDETPEGQNLPPMLTTITFPVYELGTTAVEKLFHLLHEESVEPVTTVYAKPVYHVSCGCSDTASSNPLLFTQKLENRITSLETSILTSMNMSAAFQGLCDIDDGVALLAQYINKIDRCLEFYLCLYSDWDAIKDPLCDYDPCEGDAHDDGKNVIQLKLGIRDKKRLPECSFKKSALLPEYIYKNSKLAYIYIPLFFAKREFGYIALAYENNQIDYHFQMVHWIMNINQMLQDICEGKRTRLLLAHLENAYTRDALTGLLNKQGYEKAALALMEAAAGKKQLVTAFLFDLNDLKQMNDTYGHSEGDFAIQVIGHALENAIREGDICARFSGDEFLILTLGYTKSDADALCEKVHKYLLNYNHLSSKPYTIAASGGYAAKEMVLSTDRIFDLFRAAEKNRSKQKNVPDDNATP